MSHTRPLGKTGYSRQADKQKGRFYGAANASPRPGFRLANGPVDRCALGFFQKSTLSHDDLPRGWYLSILVRTLTYWHRCYLHCQRSLPTLLLSILSLHCNFLSTLLAIKGTGDKTTDPMTTAVDSPGFYETLSQILSTRS
jgi:hypothetical protein